MRFRTPSKLSKDESLYWWYNNNRYSMVWYGMVCVCTNEDTYIHTLDRWAYLHILPKLHCACEIQSSSSLWSRHCESTLDMKTGIVRLNLSEWVSEWRVSEWMSEWAEWVRTLIIQVAVDMNYDFFHSFQEAWVTVVFRQRHVRVPPSSTLLNQRIIIRGEKWHT